MEKKSDHCAFQHDPIFAFLQDLRRVHLFYNHADAGLAVSSNNLILPMGCRAEAIAAISACVMMFDAGRDWPPSVIITLVVAILAMLISLGTFPVSMFLSLD